MNRPTTFILVHGAWHGAWCWARVIPLLQAAGAQVAVPVLRGVGERVDEATPTPTLADHIDDVIAAVSAVDPAQRVILVGHSYAGMVVTPAADQLAGRVDNLVYLDAAVPADGDDFASHIPGLAPADVERRRNAFVAMAQGSEWLGPPPPEMAGVTGEEDKAWLRANLTRHPLQTWLTPVSLGRGGLERLPKTYVLATDPITPLMGYVVHGERAKTAPGWTYAGIAAGHDMMVTAPEALAEILLSVGQAA